MDRQVVAKENQVPIKKYFNMASVRPRKPQNIEKNEVVQKPSMLTEIETTNNDVAEESLTPLYDVEPSKCDIPAVDIERLRQKYEIPRIVVQKDGKQRKLSNRELCKQITLKQEQPLQIRPMYRQGYWQSKNGDSLESYFYHNFLGDVQPFPTPAVDAAESQKNMVIRDRLSKGQRVNLFVWQTPEEFSVLEKTHGKNVTHQSLWQLPYEQLWPEEFRTANPTHKSAFLAMRNRFLNQHVKAMWPMEDGKHYLVHLHSESALKNDVPFDEHERLASGFLMMPKEFNSSFFTPDKATIMLQKTQKYPWHSGDEGWELIKKYRPDERMTIKMLAQKLGKEPPPITKTTATKPPVASDESTSKSVSTRSIATVPAKKTILAKKVGFITDERMLDHKCPCANHVENPDRLRYVVEALQKFDFTNLDSYVATDKDLGMCHQVEEIFKQIETLLKTQQTDKRVDDDVNLYVVPEKTILAARLAAGCAIELIKNIIDEKVECGFAAVRPPGHHAHLDRADGFCFFNNATLAAVYAARKDKRVLIIDFDVHFADGTEDIFNFTKNQNIACVSIHRADIFPFDESLEKYSSKDKRIRNFGFEGAKGDKHYLDTMKNLVLPFALEFKPDIIVVSAGFDAARGDPLGHCKVTPTGYKNIMRIVKSITPKIAMIMEGGYNLNALAESAAACVEVLAEN